MMYFLLIKILLNKYNCQKKLRVFLGFFGEKTKNSSKILKKLKPRSKKTRKPPTGVELIWRKSVQKKALFIGIKCLESACILYVFLPSLTKNIFRSIQLKIIIKRMPKNPGNDIFEMFS